MSEQVATTATYVPAGPDERPTARRRWHRPARWWPTSRLDCLAAVLTWLVGVPVALLIARAFNRNPFTVGGSVMPIAVGGVLGAVLLGWLLLKRSTVIVGVGMGTYAAWIALTMRAALNGTPFGYGYMLGDEGRLVAAATKDMTSWTAVDAFVPHLATEYPPLYPWLIGHTATLVNQPAWRLFQDAQIVLFTGSLILGYLLWRRLVHPAAAFMIVVLAPLVDTDPSKSYEFVTLIVIVPWILAAFPGLPRERGGMHWLPAGIIGGLIVLTYQAFLVFAMLGLIAMVALGLRAAATRRAYFLHVLGIVVTAFVVSSWYVVPFVATSLTSGGNRLSDLFLSHEVVISPLGWQFMQATPLAIIQIVGLVGIVWYRRTAWWAQPLLLLVASTLVYHAVFLLNTVHNNHTGYLQYTERLTGMLLVAAAVLTVTEALPALALRLPAPRAPRQREVAVLVVGLVVSWAAVQGWEALMPGPRGSANVTADCYPACQPVGDTNLATSAQVEPLPNGDPPRYSPPGVPPVPRFPASQVARVITSTLGGTARPVVLSYDQRLFAYEPFYGYVGPNRLAANTLARWDDRDKALLRLATVTDPTAFAKASMSTRFGPIDAFVLQRSTQGTWNFANVQFSPTSFGHQYWRVVHVPHSHIHIAVRRP